MPSVRTTESSEALVTCLLPNPNRRPAPPLLYILLLTPPTPHTHLPKGLASDDDLGDLGLKKMHILRFRKAAAAHLEKVAAAQQAAARPRARGGSWGSIFDGGGGDGNAPAPAPAAAAASNPLQQRPAAAVAASETSTAPSSSSGGGSSSEGLFAGMTEEEMMAFALAESMQLATTATASEPATQQPAAVRTGAPVVERSFSSRESMSLEESEALADQASQASRAD